ncbi:metal ABC transporter solute-binding protein, Zn/Mn family [Microbacterium indicum]|uniref:metal ABC transporter solute-binding protein, Zn/Mn family n=1 Tax=Microbacterium indicum TaxID=358100 RepID=UPI00042A2542|nr:zinc ABC transporter substrate-binding protein [Microbacterium indicum]
MLNRRALIVAPLLAVPALILAGCGSSADSGFDAAASDAGFTIVTSTNVYASILQELVGDSATVTPVISSASADPHDYEATARDQLTVDDADLVVMNGGGYDSFMDKMIDSAGVDHVISAVDYNSTYPGADAAEDEHDHGDDESADEHDHDHEHIEGFNEHVWYDPHTVEGLVAAVQTELDELNPDGSDAVATGAEKVTSDLDALEASLADIAADHTGDTAFFTEPVGAYFAEEAGLEDVTTEGFSEAVEEGQDVAPATLLAATNAISGGDVSVLIANAQTGGSETEAVIDAANEAGVPVIELTETLPDGEDFFGWMQDNAKNLADALAE